MTTPNRLGLQASAITKSYGRHKVVDDVDFRVAPGEVVALLGENGAGKSTLAKVVAGAVRQDSGTLSIDGREIHVRSPREALHEGIAFIPQELAIVPELTVGENIVLGRWPGRGFVTGPHAIAREARAAAERFGLDVDVNQRMGSLSLAGRQLAEILRALVRRASVILFDEPTSALTDRESAALLTVLRDLREKGVGLVYTSHRLEEVYAIADRLVVMRNGRVVLESTPAATDRTKLIRTMLGEAAVESERLERTKAAEGPPSGPARLRLKGWSCDRAPTLSDVTLEARAGEIVGLFGLLGAGAETVADGLAGKGPRGLTGELVVDERPRRIFRSPREAWKQGVVYLPADRKADGLILTQSLQVNLSLPNLRQVTNGGVLRLRRERAFAKRLLKQFGVRAQGPGQEAGLLSGGNQQKVMLAGRLAAAPPILVLHEPTRGVDVGARAQIHALLRDTAAGGAAILAVTSDLEEAVLLADRLLIIRNGRIVRELSGEDRTQAAALSAATSVAA